MDGDLWAGEHTENSVGWASLEFSVKKTACQDTRSLLCNELENFIKDHIIVACGFKPCDLSYLSIDFIDCYVDKYGCFCQSFQIDMPVA